MATQLDPVLEALDRAPRVGDDIDQDEIADVLRASEQPDQSIPHGEVERMIADMRRLAG
jgi:hypothetical protein